MLFWSIISFNFFMIVFYQGKMSGDVFMNTFLSNLSDVIGSFLAGFAIVFIGIKNTFLISFVATALTCEMYLSSSPAMGDGWFAFILLMNKFFINVAFTAVFFASSILF